MTINKNHTIIILVIILLLSSYQSGKIYLKAALAQWLLEGAWQTTLATGKATKPWSWADLHPIAKLNLHNGRPALLVLSGSSGRTLAFGPGQLSGSAALGEDGTTIISAHRDTHFSTLQNIQSGDAITIDDIQGQQHQYKVSDIKIVDSSKVQLSNSLQQHQLLLITCYPFNAIQAGGPLRYLVYADYLGQSI
ncbi:MAG: class GN sortase [Methylococcales bacterium]|jgi:sortase A|nr:class GN sortase [Methylococcales bacterium]MBT7444729.1 class GN sortase [Methylococcales bacterium]